MASLFVDISKAIDTVNHNDSWLENIKMYSVLCRVYWAQNTGCKNINDLQVLGV